MHDVEAVQVAIEVKGYTVLFTPPYSPEFNPVEMFFGTLKVRFYQVRSDINFTTVEESITEGLELFGKPERIKKYIRHVQDLVKDTVDKLGSTDLTTQPSHDVSRCWRRRTKLKTDGAAST